MTPSKLNAGARRQPEACAALMGTDSQPPPREAQTGHLHPTLHAGVVSHCLLVVPGVLQYPDPHRVRA